jgi:hypothetical protein
MKNLLLMVQTQSDVDALPAACPSIIAAGYTGCWIVVSPAIAVDANAAAAKFDAEIDALRKAERDAAERGDYDAASGHKLAREGKTLDRDKAVTDAWKSVPDDDRKLAYATKLAPARAAFEGRMNAKITVLQDHFAPENWIQMLNSMSGAWHKAFTHGQYVVAWPGAIPVAVAAPVKPVVASEPVAPVNAPKPVEKPEKTAPARVFASREEELTKAAHFTIRAIGRKLGVETDKRPRKDVVADILAKEAQPAIA